MKPLAILAAVLLLPSALSWAQSPDPATAEGLGLLEEGRTTLELKPLTDARSVFTQLTLHDSNNALSFYQLARVNWYLIDFYEGHHDKKGAEHALDDAIAAVQRSISLNDKSADAHSLLGDLYGRKIGFGGLLYGPRYGPKAGAEKNKALVLDPNNSRVYAGLGRGYLETPKMFGGDLGKAIANFRRATQLDPGCDENFVWLALAYRKKGNAADADKALQEALRLNPRSAFARNATSGK
jgi:tetratricopeptide (TPR) repeat protein